MQLCYIDESGTPDLPGSTDHYVLVGLSVPDEYWKQHNKQVDRVKSQYGIGHSEIHTAWMLRRYNEQEAVAGFESMSFEERRIEVYKRRNQELLRLQKVDRSRLKQTRKDFRKSEAYVHLTHDERRQAVTEIAKLIGGWGVVRLFAECIDKGHYNPLLARTKVHEQAFEQVVSRFEQYLQRGTPEFGLIIHDNNHTVAERHTELMKNYQRNGTFWTGIEYVIEDPMFVDSQLNSTVQLADVCAYALRRYLENSEKELFDLVFERADRLGDRSVGVRHFTSQACLCKICNSHAAPS